MTKTCQFPACTSGRGCALDCPLDRTHADASRSASSTVGRVLLWVLGLFIGGAAIAAMIGGVVLRGLGLLQAAVILGGVGLAIIERL